MRTATVGIHVAHRAAAFGEARIARVAEFEVHQTIRRTPVTIEANVVRAVCRIEIVTIFCWEECTTVC